MDQDTRLDDPADLVFRVATCNPRHGAGRFGLVSNRKLALTCRSLDADILALQEVDRFVVRSWFRDQPELIARALAHHHVATVAKPTPVGGTQCNAITSRGQFHDVATVELPRAEGQERRVALIARLALGGSDITVACTHLQHRRGGGREQLAAVLVALGERPGPRVLAGDFNLEPGDVEPILAARGFTAAPSGPTNPAISPRRRIDYVAVDGGLRIAGARVHAPLVGDHCPVVADLVLRA